MKPPDKVLKVYLGPIPQRLDPTNVTTFTQYVVIQQMTRGLLTLDANGQITGDLAVSWKITDGGRKYIFTLRDDQKFSNGESVLAESFVGSIHRQIKKGRTIHFDFNEILSVVSLNQKTLELVLRNPDHHFMNKLLYPEFALLHSSDFNKSTDTGCEWKVTSGMTTLKEVSSDRITLFQKHPKKREIWILGSLQKNGESVSREIDFFIGIPPLSADSHLEATKDFDAYSPRLDFTFFFTVGSQSIFAKDLQRRFSLFSDLYEFRENLQFNSPFHFSSRQLYLEDGPGRTSHEKLSSIKTHHENGKSRQKESQQLRVLVQKSFPYQNQLVSFLSRKNMRVLVDQYNNFDEFEALKKENIYDLIQSNNDFSALDLSLSVLVTLNPQRPLVETFGDKEVDALKRNLESEESEEKRNSLVQSIEELLLERGYVFPIYHLNMYFYVKKNLDHNCLSRCFPEVAVWKLN